MNLEKEQLSSRIAKQKIVTDLNIQEFISLDIRERNQSTSHRSPKSTNPLTNHRATIKRTTCKGKCSHEQVQSLCSIFEIGFSIHSFFRQPSSKRITRSPS